jgi:hypothetical protein
MHRPGGRKATILKIVRQFDRKQHLDAAALLALDHSCGFVIADLVNDGHSASAAGVSLSWSEAARDHQKPHDHCRCFSRRSVHQ